LLTERVEVRLLELVVVALGENGVHEPGLRREDFVVLVDGVASPIAFFDEIRDGRTSDEGTGGQGDPARRGILVFVDDYFPSAQDRDAVLRAFDEQLHLLGAGDLVSIVAFDGEGIERITEWSNDATVLREGIQSALRRPAHGMNGLGDSRHRLRRRHFAILAEIEGGVAARDRDSGVRSMEEAAGGGAMRAAQRGAEARTRRAEYEERLRDATIVYADRLRRSAEAVSDAMLGSEPAEGRKILLLVAGGWPEHPALFLMNNDHPALGRLMAAMEVGNHGGHDLLSPITHTAASLGYTLYPVDAIGRVFEPVREVQTASSLEWLAETTGGVAFLDDDRTEALAGALADSGSFYSLGVSPAEEVLERPLEIEIRVLRRGIRVKTLPALNADRVRQP
jgi:VWFA-related protein